MIGWRARHRAGRLRLLVLAVSDRCDQRCAHCSIWKAPARGRALSREERLAVVEEAIAEGVGAALLTGGEPLLSADLWPIAQRFRADGVRLMLATNGMLLERCAAHVGRLFDEVYVSLDGASPVTHDAIRGVSSWTRLAAGVAALGAVAPAVRRIARCTLHAGNVHELPAVVARARDAGFHAVSFLPLDASSDAFGGDVAARGALVPSLAAVRALEADIDRMQAAGAFADGFVMEDAAKLRRLARHLAASVGAARFDRPPCDAPWWSTVVEADGVVRPCFFQPAVGDATEGLRAVRASARYTAALRAIAAGNETCTKCVCPKRAGR